MDLYDIPTEIRGQERRLRALELQVRELRKLLDNKMYSCKDTAAMLGISVNTLRKYRRQGEIFPVLGYENFFSIKSIRDFQERRARGC